MKKKPVSAVSTKPAKPVKRNDYLLWLINSELALDELLQGVIFAQKHAVNKDSKINLSSFQRTLEDMANWLDDEITSEERKGE